MRWIRRFHRDRIELDLWVGSDDKEDRDAHRAARRGCGGTPAAAAAAVLDGWGSAEAAGEGGRGRSIGEGRQIIGSIKLGFFFLFYTIMVRLLFGPSLHMEFRMLAGGRDGNGNLFNGWVVFFYRALLHVLNFWRMIRIGRPERWENRLLPLPHMRIPLDPPTCSSHCSTKDV